jgi:hypothetical protein
VSTTRIPAMARPVRRAPAKPPNPALAWAGESSAALAHAVLRRPGATLVGLVILGGVASVGWNLTMGQPGRHPAPLFGAKASEKVSESRPVQAAAAPLPVPRPEPQAMAQLIPEPPQSPVTTQSTDRIGALIRSEPARIAEGETRRVAAAQKALSKLGYGPLKSDGVIGPETKTALERFERERKLPVTGAVGARTARLLAQQAGIMIE